mmetsp:Transcript_5465/g.9731  ORF Transcript_5465/g.9731 Transcript_5465/m.9731 type:complete len:479 (-) Transcript_5465:36-1472(-)
MMWGSSNRIPDSHMVIHGPAEVRVEVLNSLSRLSLTKSRGLSRWFKFRKGEEKVKNKFRDDGDSYIMVLCRDVYGSDLLYFLKCSNEIRKYRVSDVGKLKVSFTLKLRSPRSEGHRLHISIRVISDRMFEVFSESKGKESILLRLCDTATRVWFGNAVGLAAVPNNGNQEPTSSKRSTADSKEQSRQKPVNQQKHRRAPMKPDRIPHPETSGNESEPEEKSQNSPPPKSCYSKRVDQSGPRSGFSKRNVKSERKTQGSSPNANIVFSQRNTKVYRKGGEKDQEERVVQMKRILTCDDPYRMLDVERGISRRELRKVYRKLILIWHPDKNSMPGSQECFARIHSAFQTIAARCPDDIQVETNLSNRTRPPEREEPQRDNVVYGRAREEQSTRCHKKRSQRGSIPAVELVAGIQVEILNPRTNKWDAVVIEHVGPFLDSIIVSSMDPIHSHGTEEIVMGSVPIRSKGFGGPVSLSGILYN